MLRSKKSITRRLLSLTLLLGALLAFQPAALAQRPDAPTRQAPARRIDPRTKIHANLLADMASSQRAGLQRAGTQRELSFVARIAAGTDLGHYTTSWFARPFVDPTGGTVAYGTATAGNILKLAALDGVRFIQRPESLVAPPAPTDPDLASLNQALKARLSTTPQAAPAPEGWFDTGRQIHGSKQAWSKGYTGKGVRLMINDSGADYCHPDLYGTWAYIDDKASPYYGLPQMFDSVSSFRAAADFYLGTSFVAEGQTDYADTSLVVRGPTAQFQPIGATTVHTYTLPRNSRSGQYHIGSHPDKALATNAAVLSEFFGDATAAEGERAAVLVVDSKTAGVYDRVYVDLNYNYDFTDDRPARLDRGFGRREVACLDYNGDNMFDISGGLVYFIADGTNAVPTLDWYWGVPGEAYGAGDLVAFHVMDYTEGGEDHGMGCTSVAVGRGRVSGSVNFAPGGPPQAEGRGLVVGPGRDAKTVQNGDFYLTPFIEDAYIYAGLGYDGEGGTSDDVQIVSNSWGFSATDNDGWDGDSRLIDLINRLIAPRTAILKSTGNGAAGYGTIAPPSGAAMINVGASTLYDEIGTFEPIASARQIVGGDPMSWSNRGPGALINNGPDVIATGAFGVGSLPLNMVLDGSIATESFGGTSMATPVAAGNLALIIQAWKQRTGEWPDFEQSRALLMASARDSKHDVWTQGGGLVNADEGTDVAAGRSGAYATPADWTVGDYRGEDFGGFAKIIAPGGSDTQTFTLWNPSNKPLKVDLSANWFTRIGTKDYSFSSLDVALDHGNANIPDYVVRIDQDIPAGTDLLQVRQAYPYDQFNPTGSLGATARYNNWRLHVLNWTDLDRDGKFWNDADGNGKVSLEVDESGAVVGSEMEALEFVRFSYGYDMGPTQQARVGSPLQRKADGILVGFRHRDRLTSVPTTDMQVEASYWDQTSWPWASFGTRTLTIPARGSATFNATVAIPAGTPYGMYEGAIAASYKGHKGAEEVLIPVTVAVAASGTSFNFGGASTFPAQLYDNSAVFGYTDYSWRAESGDWRFFWADVQEGDLPAEGSSYLLVDNSWAGAGADIDTLVMGPTPDCASNGEGCSALFPGFPGAPDFYGPYTLAPVGGSPNAYVGSGRWAYQTSSGGPNDLIAAPAQAGLHGIFLHHVRVDGRALDEPFSGKVGLATLSAALIEGDTISGTASISISSELALAGFVAEGFGLSQPVTSTETIEQDDPDDPATSSFVTTVNVEHGAELTVATTSEVGGMDIDLYVLDADGNLVGASTTSTADEVVTITFPADGEYTILVHGFSVPGGSAEFELLIDAVQGNDLTVSDLPAAIPAGGTGSITVGWDATGRAPGVYKGVVLMGPANAPGLLRVPVRITVP